MATSPGSPSVGPSNQEGDPGDNKSNEELNHYPAHGEVIKGTHTYSVSPWLSPRLVHSGPRFEAVMLDHGMVSMTQWDNWYTIRSSSSRSAPDGVVRQGKVFAKTTLPELRLLNMAPLATYMSAMHGRAWPVSEDTWWPLDETRFQQVTEPAQRCFSLFERIETMVKHLKTFRPNTS